MLFTFTLYRVRSRTDPCSGGVGRDRGLSSQLWRIEKGVVAVRLQRCPLSQKLQYVRMPNYCPAVEKDTASPGSQAPSGTYDRRLQVRRG